MDLEDANLGEQRTREEGRKDIAHPLISAMKHRHSMAQIKLLLAMLLISAIFVIFGVALLASPALANSQAQHNWSGTSSVLLTKQDLLNGVRDAHN